MSHVTGIKTIVRDLVALASGAQRHGGVLVEGQRTFKSYGGQRNACDHALRFDGCKYEVGVVAQHSGGYQLQFDAWSSGGLGARIGQNGEKLVQSYAAEKTKREARRIGFRVSEVPQADGRIKMLLHG